MTAFAVSAVQGATVAAMQNVWMQSNYAGLDGGAIHLETTTAPTAWTNLTMIGNHAKSFAGAIQLTDGGFALVSSLVANNIADSYAGGLFAFFGVMYVYYTSITGNS